MCEWTQIWQFLIETYSRSEVYDLFNLTDSPFENGMIGQKPDLFMIWIQFQSGLWLELWGGYNY